MTTGGGMTYCGVITTGGGIFIGRGGRSISFVGLTLLSRVQHSIIAISTHSIPAYTKKHIQCKLACNKRHNMASGSQICKGGGGLFDAVNCSCRLA